MVAAGVCEIRSSLPQHPMKLCPRNPSKTKDRLYLGILKQSFEIETALVKLFERRLVVWWCTVTTRGDEDVGQLESISTAVAVRLRGKASAIEGCIQEVAASITGEHSSRSVCAVSGGSEPENEKLCLGVAKVRDRFSPIDLGGILPTLLTSNSLSPLD